jgi:type VII secretion protein EccB
MATRKDQLQSYQFMMQRVISSIMLRETDPEQTPLRRGVGAVFGGVMLTGLLAIAFAVYGVISGNVGTRWQQDNALVIERETGALYIYRAGVLQPVLNYASARLLIGVAEPQRVAGRNLAGIPRAVPVGIPGAPDSLPPTGRLVGVPWTICSALGREGALQPPITVLLVGERVPGATALADQAVLVRDPEDDSGFLIWHSHRYRITEDPQLVIQSLYGSQVPVVDAGSAWLNGLPAGQDLAPIEVNGVGDPSTAVPGRAIGDLVYHELPDGTQDYLVLDDGFAALTDLQVALLREPDAEPEEVTAAEVRSLPSSGALVPAGGEAAPPATAPQLAPLPADGRVTLCAETTDGRSPPGIALGGDLLAVADAAVPTSAESAEGIRLADWVLVPPGHGAVVRALPSETAGVGAYHLVTDLGLRYPVPSEAVLALLGYTPADAVDMPAALVHRIPAGPTLDPVAAAATQ